MRSSHKSSSYSIKAITTQHHEFSRSLCGCKAESTVVKVVLSLSLPRFGNGF